jgi:hypothetical protein
MIRVNRPFLVKAGIFLLSAAIVILTPLVLIFHNSEAALTKPELYKKILSSQNTYGRISELAAGQLIHQFQSTDDPAARPGFIHITKNSEQLLKNLDQAELEKLISMLLPVNWAQVKLENIIDQYAASMNNRIYRPTLLVAMDDIKDRLQGKVGRAFFIELIRAQPPCTEQQKNAWQSAPLEEAPACYPSETILKELEPKTGELLYQITARMPDDASLDYFFGPMGFTSGQETVLTRLQDSAVRFWRARVLLRISPLLLLVLLFLLGLFHTPARPFTRLWATPVLLAGLLSLLAGVLAWPVTRWYIDSEILSNLPPYISPALMETGADVAGAAFAGIRPLILIQSLLIFLLGGLLLLADRLQKRGFRFRKPSTKKYTL